MLLQHLEETTNSSASPVPAKRARKASRHLQSYLVKDATASNVATRQSPRKGKKSSSSISLARRTLDDSIDLRPLSDREDLFETVDIEFDNIRLKQKVQELEEEIKALKEQLDIQDTVKQLKRVVKKLTSVSSLTPALRRHQLLEKKRSAGLSRHSPFNICGTSHLMSVSHSSHNYISTLKVVSCAVSFHQIS
ncbi:hypothetical protein BSL78_18371 [Apostichopus japonicus]|uniref:Uncharacterized protein n=1 Tax=Stichopus japonicus TaxID=307972 RepID=A0A2G8K9S8_STIJA|nr:hypothetical protein BSL78_18371 [Apostichopus japonicus]